MLALAAAFLAACGGDGLTPPTPPPGPPVGRDADLDSLYGSAAPAIAAAIQANRAALDSAAEALLGAPATGGDGLAAGATAARTLRAAAAPDGQPLPIHWADTRTRSAGDALSSWSVTTRKTLDATLTGTTLVVVGTERTETRALKPGDPAQPRHSALTEMRAELTVQACPDAQGRAAGRWSSYDRTWSTLGAATPAGPDTYDMLTEVTAEGPVAAHVDDAAELRGYDLDVGVTMRKTRTPGNRPIDKRGTVRIARSDVAPARLRDALGDAMLAAKTGDYDLLHTLGIGPEELNALLTMRVGSTYGRARALWRGGTCVEVVEARGAQGGALAPGSAVDLGPEARSRVDGAAVSPATLDAAPTAGTVAAPAAGVPHPATFRFTMPPQGGATVSFTATSRRGIGFGSVAFSEGGALVGELTNDASVRYTLSGGDEWGQTFDGSISGAGHVASHFRLRFARRDADGTLHYDVLAENQLSVSGSGELHAKRSSEVGTDEVTVRPTLDGTGVTHNPVGPGDRPLEEGLFLAPDGWEPSPAPGEVRFWTRGGQHFYELRLNPMQIVPNFTWWRRSRSVSEPCTWTQTSTFENATRHNAVVVDDPKHCLDHREQEYDTDFPYTFGFVAHDFSAYDPATHSNAIASGTWNPGAPGDLAGSRAENAADCDQAERMDPTQLGRWAETHAGFPITARFQDHGTCQVTSTIRWTIPVPPEARQQALAAAAAARAARAPR